MDAVSSTFLGSSLALHVRIHPPLPGPVSCLPENRSSRFLATAISALSDNLELAKSVDMNSPFKPRPRWWIPLLPGAPELWSSNSPQPFGDSSSTDDGAYVLQANTVYVKPLPETAVKGSPKKSGGRARKVVFTPEMARKLRKQMKGNDSFHDFMYHSAIASRLASKP